MSSANYKIVARLDGMTAAAHRLAIEELLSGDVCSLDLDLSDLEYVSSAGLQILLLAAKAAKSKGGRILLISPKPHILEVLRLTGLVPVHIGTS
jgi:stage II sporulation protein AA (anti-sigma F factor antagonist)